MIDIRKQIYQEKQSIDRHVAHIKKSNISKRNKQLILDFANFCSALGNSQHRIAIALRHLLMFAERLEGDFDKADRKAIENAIAKLNQSHYSEWTKFTVKKLVKRFY
ncbi:MAG: hypothetical protein HZB65_01415, partial [Candidatus Aenigmarchaeota archaeon]|nr:hypothetical protein [Candidatus Aenigmarchaeota archaeon]